MSAGRCELCQLGDMSCQLGDVSYVSWDAC